LDGPVTQWLFLAAAGVVAGIIGTAGGITSLVAYPALLAVGIPALAANVTNSVALLGSGFGSVLRAGPDVAGHERTLRTWAPAAVLCSLAGALLLIFTPGQTFDRIVPFLIAAGSTVLLLQPAIARRDKRPNATLIVLGGIGVTVYNGYFGAGSGILMIALLLLTTEPVLHRANALKNVLLFAADLLPAVVFAVSGKVVWHAVWPLGVGALLGGLTGPTIARRVNPQLLRILIAVCGFGLAIGMLIT
jgi:uncharacterized membrane protein YfcA